MIIINILVFQALIEKDAMRLFNISGQGSKCKLGIKNLPSVTKLVTESVKSVVKDVNLKLMWKKLSEYLRSKTGMKGEKEKETNHFANQEKGRSHFAKKMLISSRKDLYEYTDRV